ncbi:hypothetical protein JR316_0010955 [Psilocybe cubensis]|uniref:Uncharacterized protein n=1 Tax=Psilocybe cubensis TaxID=181762 RepID=A0ACB8GN95_PSICU|nr:hypothetical protein JR316_0010955 [Psilocybe cubensis]KAH9477039.1 hypothetical protein JR316_0010955 [Psilocybe cubensis]
MKAYNGLTATAATITHLKQELMHAIWLILLDEEFIEWIFKHGKDVKSTCVKDILQDILAVPTQNAFSTRLSQFGFNLHSMFVPDFLHKFELGVWKSFFMHMI